MRVWVTRAQPGAAATAARLRARGFDPVVAPLLEVRPLPGNPIDLVGVAAVAFTSANGVAAFAGRSAVRDLPVFTVGAATATAARAAGFVAVVSADGEVEALAPVIAAHGPFIGAVLHPGPAEPAGDLVGSLAAMGLPARALAVYETVVLAPRCRVAAEAVILHSPKAARALAAHLAAHPSPLLAAICLSPAVAAPLLGAGLASVQASLHPTENDLLALLVTGVAR